MITLISTFFRAKTRFILPLIIFTVLTVILICFLENYNKTIVEIDKIKEKTENRKIVVLLENNVTVDDIYKMNHIESIELRGDLNSSTYATILVEKESNMKEVMLELKNMGTNPSVFNDDSQIELNSHKELESFYKTMIIVVIITFIIITLTEIKLLLTWDEKNIKFLKIMGYQDHTVCIITLLKIFLLILMAIIISLVSLILLDTFLNFSFHLSTILFLVIILMVIIVFQIPFLLSKLRKFDYNYNL